jgi:hypothetical protein
MSPLKSGLRCDVMYMRSRCHSDKRLVEMEFVFPGCPLHTADVAMPRAHVYIVRC